MKYVDFLGLKLTDIGSDDDNQLILSFSGGHQLIIKRDNVHSAALLKRPRRTTAEVENEKQAMADAKVAAKKARMDKIKEKESGTAIKTPKKVTVKKPVAKPTAKKIVAKPTAKKPVAKKTTAKKPAPKKTPVKKTVKKTL